MIGLTNETITIPFVKICTQNGFWTGFILGIIFLILLIYTYKLVTEVWLQNL